MEDHPSRRFSLLASWPEAPKKKRTPRRIPFEMNNSTTDPPLNLQIYEESPPPETNMETRTRKRSKMTNKGRKKRKALTKPPVEKLHAMPDVLRRKIREMGGEGIILILQKQLSYTDVSTVNSRLSIPRCQLIFEFLSEEEKTFLDGTKDNSKRKAGIDVLVIDPSLEERELSFKKWKMESTCVFNVIHWNELRDENGLEAGDTIQVWSFRNKQRKAAVGSDLCFALVKLEIEEDSDDGGAESEAEGVA